MAPGRCGRLLAPRAHADGTDRPAWRGLLHGALALLCGASLPVAAGLCAAGAVPACWWRLVVHCAGKFTSYLPSAVYHLYPFGSAAVQMRWRKADLSAIVLAAGAPWVAVAPSPAAGAAAAAATAAASGGTWALTEARFRWPAATWQHVAARYLASALQLAFSAGVFSSIGWHSGYQRLWIATVLAYLCAFSLSPPAHPALERLGPARWHRARRNGWHEDFHVLLTVADLLLLWLLVRIACGGPALGSGGRLAADAGRPGAGSLALGAEL